MRYCDTLTLKTKFNIYWISLIIWWLSIDCFVLILNLNMHHTKFSKNFSLFPCSCNGYISPEYATFGQLSTKLDVYSFGILLLEIVSGRKNMFDSTLQMHKIYLVKWVHTFLTRFQFFYAIFNSNNWNNNILNILNVFNYLIKFQNSFGIQIWIAMEILMHFHDINVLFFKFTIERIEQITTWSFDSNYVCILSYKLESKNNINHDIYSSIFL